MSVRRYKQNDVLILRRESEFGVKYTHKIYKYYLRSNYEQKGYVIVGRLRKYISKKAFRRYKKRQSIKRRFTSTTKFAIREWLRLRSADYRTKHLSEDELLTM